jgi:ribonuclease P protein component
LTDTKGSGAKGFGRRQRLLTAADYRRVFSKPDSKAGQSECLMLAAVNELGHHRLGLAVAKKHIPAATRRNRFKRLAREHFRQLAPASFDTTSPGIDIVVLSRPGANTATAEDLSNAISRQLQRVIRRVGARGVREPRQETDSSAG